MSDVEQVIKGDGNTTIGTQANYYSGLSLDDVYSLAKKLFVENFPQLQEIAMVEVTNRVDEFLSNLGSKIKANNDFDFTVFAEPANQYILTKAETEYARYGDKNKIEILTELVYQRLTADKNIVIESTLDNAVEIINKLSPAYLDLLSLIFICKHCRYGNVNSPDDLSKVLKKDTQKLLIGEKINYFYLLSLNVLAINIGDGLERLKKVYGFFPNSNLFNIELLKAVPGDYGLNNTGIALAIVNLNIKNDENMCVEDFLR